MTNAQAAEKYGLAPILNDGYVATLHHSQQRSVGPLFEASTRYHNISNAKKDRSIHIKVNLIRLTRWIVIQEVYSKRILLNIGKQEEEML